MKQLNKTVFVGLSGGVDSSVSALLLKEQGYTVVGVYMKNWSRDLPGMPCPWKDDYQDAKRIAVQLGIDFICTWPKTIIKTRPISCIELPKKR
jgi:tRNA-specific 2-thiouridylase